VNGSFIQRNAGVGNDFFSVSARLSRVFRLTKRVELETIAEAFNLTNRRNVLVRNANFGTGEYPGTPLPTFGRITAVADPRTYQIGVRARF
jgi:hypothetical protein